MTPSETMTPVTKKDNKQKYSLLSPLEENLQSEVSEKLEVLLSDAVKKAIPQLISELKNQIQLSITEMESDALADLKTGTEGGIEKWDNAWSTKFGDHDKPQNPIGGRTARKLQQTREYQDP